MAETVYGERMSDSDALTWHIERDPLLRSTILGVWLFDRLPAPERFRGKIRATVRRIPRLRQRVVEDPLGVAPPRWVDVADVDLDYHLREVRAPGKGDLRDLLDVARPIAMQAFDRDRPLWELWLVDGLEGGRAGGVLKLHHAISDGVGLVRMTASLIERSPDAPPEPDAEPEPGVAASVPEALGPIDETLEALRYQAVRRLEQGRSAATALLQGLSRVVRDPLDAVRDAADLAASAGRLLAPASQPLSPLWRGRSLRTQLDAFARPLEALKSAGSAVGGTVNDVFVAGVAGGMQRYHARRGHAVDRLRMTMPINLRHGERGRQAGNQFAPVRFAVPVGIEDPAERVRAIHALVERERGEPSLPALDVLAGALNRLPVSAQVAAFGGMLKSVDFITSNVPGPAFPVWVAGARVLEMIPFGPLSGAAANVVLFSYDGRVQIGITSDGAAIDDPAALRACLEAGLDEVLALA